MGGYFFRVGLLGIAPGWSFQEGGRKAKAFCSHMGNVAASDDVIFKGGQPGQMG